MKTRKALTILMLIFVVSFIYLTIHSAVVLSDNNYTYIADYKWNKNLDNGLAIAKEENKPVFIYFWAVWCQYCEKFETQTLPDERVRQMLENDFVLVAVDLDENVAASQRYGVRNPPHELFVDENGQIINRVGGYVDPDYFYNVLQMVKADYYSTHGGQ
jgi:thioredoxin-related protein